MRIRIYPHKRGRPSAKALARACYGKVIRRSNSRFSRDNRHFVVNWGATDVPYRVDINQPEAVAVAINKIKAFGAMDRAGVTIPRYTTDRSVAKQWKRVVVRRRITARGGIGASVVETGVEYLPYAPLYTEYVPKTDEYRVHVYRGKEFFVQRKARSYSAVSVNWKIRSHSNGFIYAHQNIEIPPKVPEEACKAVSSLGLDLGAVDVVWNKRRNKAYVLEVNTAPGLEGTTLEKYKEVIWRNNRR